MSQHPLARYGAVLGVGLVAGGVAGGTAGAVSVLGPDSIAGAALIAVVTSAAMALALWVSLRWWRGLDEAAQEAHKWAWWWGASIGMALSGVALFTMIYGAPGRLGGDPADILLGGAAIVALFQLAGYGVAWIVWWLKRR